MSRSKKKSSRPSRSRATHTIEIDSFVPRDEIDKRYYNHPYYIAPDGKAAIDAFAVIRDAMKDEDRVALARVVLTNREHVIAIEPLGKGLLGTTLRYPYELRDEEDYFDAIKTPKITRDMVELASHILRHQGRAFRSLEIQGRIRGRTEGAGAAQGLRQAGQGRRARGEARQRRQPDGRTEGEPEGKIGDETADAWLDCAAGAGTPDSEEDAPFHRPAPQGGVRSLPSLRAKRSNP